MTGALAGTFKPRISRAAGGAKQDIANTSFADLSDADQAPFVADAEFVERWLSAIGAATEFTAYGPTIQFDIIDLPAQSRQLKKWQVRAVVEGLEGTVKRRTYPLEGTPAGQVVPPIKFSLKVRREQVGLPISLRWCKLALHALRLY